MPDYNTLVDFAQKANTPRRTEQARVIAEVGRRARMVLEHPGWDIFLAHIDRLQEEAEKSRDALTKRLVTGLEIGDELTRLKIQTRRLDGMIEAFQQVMNLVPELVKRGEQVIEDLKYAESDSR